MKIFPLIVLLLLFSVKPASGCSYIGYPEPPLSYVISKLKTIYYGTVVSIKTRYEKDEDGYRWRVRRVGIKTDRTLKGDHKEFQEFQLSNQINQRKDSCYVAPKKLNVGETWLIQTDLDTETDSRISRWGLSFDGLVKLDPKEDLDFVTKLENIIKKPVTAIFGQLQTVKGGAITTGTEVHLEGMGQQLSVNPTGFGEYSFENLPAGNYKIQIRIPVKAKDWYTDKVSVYNAKTDTWNFEYQITLKPGDSDYYFSVVIDQY